MWYSGVVESLWGVAAIFRLYLQGVEISGLRLEAAYISWDASFVEIEPVSSA